MINNKLRRQRRPYIPRGCDQQGRLHDGRHETESSPYRASDLIAAAALVLFALVAAFMMPECQWTTR